MAKKNILNENNEVVNELETTIETTEVATETVVETVTETITEVVVETVTETIHEVVVETRNTLLHNYVCELERGVYQIEIQLIDTEDRIIVPVNIIPSRKFGDMNVLDYITYYLTSELKYKRFTVISMN